MKTNYEKLYLIQPQIYYKMLPLMNIIDKRAVEEINNENITEESNLEQNGANIVAANGNNDYITRDNNNMQSHYLETEQLPSISEKSMHTESNSNESISQEQTIPAQYVLEQPLALSSTNDASKINFPSEAPSKVKPPQNVPRLSVTVPVNVPEIKPLSEIHPQSIDASKLNHVIASEKPEQMNSVQENLSTSVSKTKRKRYLCEVCTNRGFTTKFSLKRHNNQFHSLNKMKTELNKASKSSSTIPTSRHEPDDVSKSFKRSREMLDDKIDEIHFLPDSKKLKARGLKRSADVFQNEMFDQHLPRKSARVESYKRKNQWTENSAPKRLAIQRGQGFSNWVNF